MNRLVSKIVEIDGGELVTYSGNYDFYARSSGAIAEKQQEAQFERQGGDARARSAPSSSPASRRARRASHAAQVQSRA